MSWVAGKVKWAKCEKKLGSFCNFAWVGKYFEVFYVIILNMLFRTFGVNCLSGTNRKFLENMWSVILSGLQIYWL